jgi:SAM-dependent methyltransferase
MRAGDRLERLVLRIPLLRRPFYQRNAARAERDQLARRIAADRAASGLPCLVERDAATPCCSPDIRMELRSLREWQEFASAHPVIFDRNEPARLAAHGARHGVLSPFLGAIGPDEVDIAGETYSEQYVARGFTARQRALLDMVACYARDRRQDSLRIFAHEGLTRLALALRGIYPRFLGSEYACSEQERQAIFPVPSIDITQSGLPDGSFDLVLSADVLEHVHDLGAALHDTARILVPGGRFLASFPFTLQQETLVKARLVNGAVEHLAPPEYHGNPMNPRQGSLVFQLPGWDILDSARRAGFADACMVFWSSCERGYVGSPGLAGLLLMVATR